ncbi:hypothetical protein BCR33DRAFT_717529 [Rhizoclosmatium globosum]|uniref:Diphthine--ammonia ligase n=1 Tax=Rhizoclosmatium globosum TaxID=329046 RepID=A0A1Y2C8L2_9FUNG|nr:hypothetical protein BCR33DRAFT_717529 [Rhizoclosmatium globosum]|eukprot:ORY43286.1 hypothetical protein BCR33DRAFT_717529 [Rhizoclosmatium globosum]
MEDLKEFGLPCLTHLDGPANVHISFTGGKDSVLTLELIKTTMPNLTIKKLVTFFPITNTAHPNDFIAFQAEALGFPSEVNTISGDPSYLETYRAHMKRFTEQDQVAALATGDIEDVGHGFMGKAAYPTGLRILSPLFQRPREEILALFRKYQLKPVITLISLGNIPHDIAVQLIGRVLDDTTLGIMRAHNVRVARGEVPQGITAGKPNKHNNEVDLCGENGEYHTMCLDGLSFKKRVCLVDVTTRKEIQGHEIPTIIKKDPWGEYLHLDYSSFGFELRDK